MSVFNITEYNIFLQFIHLDFGKILLLLKV